jgi:heme/copper-type cytochrome/quinol oxidase subunit 4
MNMRSYWEQVLTFVVNIVLTVLTLFFHRDAAYVRRVASLKAE